MRKYTLTLEEIAMGYDEARSSFCRREETRWVSYVAGIFIVLRRERSVCFFPGRQDPHCIGCS